MVKRTDIVWYAIRITYSREMALKEYLDSQSIECFVPMHYELVIQNGQKQRKLVSIIHNLAFVHASRLQLDSVKSEMGHKLPIRYIMDKSTQTPIVVPDKQMHDFISVSGSNDEGLVYLSPAEYLFKKGDRVRIIDGLFCGVEGILLRIKGDRRVVIAIEGVMAVATAFIHPSFLKPVEE